jgi:hypothetical protein
VSPAFSSSNELFDAAVNKMIKLDFSKLGILLGHRQRDGVDSGLLHSIFYSDFARKNTDIIQASGF